MQSCNYVHFQTNTRQELNYPLAMIQRLRQLFFYKECFRLKQPKKVDKSLKKETSSNQTN